MRRILTLSFALCVLLADLALGQYEIPSFAGPVAYGVEAATLPPGAFTWSENFYSKGGRRIARRGITRAMGSKLSSTPILDVFWFRHEGDSLAVVIFNNGKWYYSNYAAVKTAPSNWYDQAPAAEHYDYISGFTLHTFKEIRPWASGNITAQVGVDSIYTASENSAQFVKYAAIGDTVYIASGGGYRVLSTIREIHTNRVVYLDAGADSTMTNRAYYLARPFSQYRMPDHAVVDKKAYVVNGVDPMQTLIWYDSTLWMKESHIADKVSMTDAEVFFTDSTWGWVSNYGVDTSNYDTHADSAVCRFLRIYDYTKAWAIGEWAGQLDIGPTGMYFFRLGSPMPGGGTDSVDRRRDCLTLPIIGNDENSLILMNPIAGELNSIFDSADIQECYPANDQADYYDENRIISTNLNSHWGYIFSVSGNGEVVYPNDSTATIISRYGGAIWKLPDEAGRFAEGDLRDGIYFLHDLSNNGKGAPLWFTDQRWKYVTRPHSETFDVPTGWEFVSSQWGKVRTSPYETFEGPTDTYRYHVGDTISYLAPTRGWFHIRYVHHFTDAGTDTSYFVSSVQPIEDSVYGAEFSTAEWELIKFDVPRFAGITTEDNRGVAGWGDINNAAVLSRSAITLRGPEPESWNGGADVTVSPLNEAITAVVPYDNLDLVFTETSIYGAQPAEGGGYLYKEIAKGIGCVAPQSIVVNNKFVYFMAEAGYMRIQRRDLTGYTITDATPMLVGLLNSEEGTGYLGHRGSILKINDAQRHLVVARWNPRDRRIWIWFPAGSSNYCNYAVTFDPETGVVDGVQTVPAVDAVPLKLRDSTFMLVSVPDSAFLGWQGVGAGDMGFPITSSIEGVMYGVYGDSIYVSPALARLTYSTDASASPFQDTLKLLLENLGNSYDSPISTTVVDTVAPASANYLNVWQVPLPTTGSSPFWRWRVEYVHDTVNTLRRFQPIRMWLGLRTQKAGY